MQALYMNRNINQVYTAKGNRRKKLGQESGLNQSRKGDNADLIIEDEFFSPVLPGATKVPNTAYGGKRNPLRNSNKIENNNDDGTLSSVITPRARGNDTT